MFVLSGFGDEISPDLGVQLDVLEKLGIRYLELREVWNKGVLDLDDDEVATIKRELEARGMGVSAIGSPIGKIKIDDPMGPHLRAFDRAVYLAEFLGSPYIRMFSFYVPQGEADRYRSEVMDRLRALLDHAQGHEVVLLHENESHIYGDIPRRCLDILETMASPQLRMTFDPANFVMNGIHPFIDAYGLLADHIAYLHVKDGLMAEKRVVPAGEGDGQVSEVLAALSARGYGGQDQDMFASLEPHLRHAGPFRGFSGPELFQTAAQALRRLLQDVGAQERR